MFKLLRLGAATVALLSATVAFPQHWIAEPVDLGWSAEQVERASDAQLLALTQRAERAQQLGCRTHCERLNRVFARLIVEARKHSARSAGLPWSLTVVRLPGLDAMAMPDGRVIISETFVDQRLASDEALAFVMAHEMAHSILEHERQTLTFARALLPRQVERSVGDIYFEIDYNITLRKSLEPVMQQGEYEADQLGLLLASAAGYDPAEQLIFAEQECEADSGAATMVATHPAACMRLKALQSLLASAQRCRSDQIAQRDLPNGAQQPCPSATKR